MSAAFQIDTKGFCLLCYKKCTISNNSCASFKIMMSYLKVNLWKLSKMSAEVESTGQTGQSGTNVTSLNLSQHFVQEEMHPDFEVDVSICTRCAIHMKIFSSSASTDNRMPKKKMKEVCQSIYNLMDMGMQDTNSVDAYKRKVRSRNPHEIYQNKLAANVREELMGKLRHIVGLKTSKVPEFIPQLHRTTSSNFDFIPIPTMCSGSLPFPASVKQEGNVINISEGEVNFSIIKYEPPEGSVRNYDTLNIVEHVTTKSTELIDKDKPNFQSKSSVTESNDFSTKNCNDSGVSHIQNTKNVTLSLTAAPPSKSLPLESDDLSNQNCTESKINPKKKKTVTFSTASAQLNLYVKPEKCDKPMPIMPISNGVTVTKEKANIPQFTTQRTKLPKGSDTEPQPHSSKSMPPLPGTCTTVVPLSLVTMKRLVVLLHRCDSSKNVKKDTAKKKLCARCHGEFYSKTALDIHMYKAHGKVFPQKVKCNQCNMWFSKNWIEKHKDSVHKVVKAHASKKSSPKSRNEKNWETTSLPNPLVRGRKDYLVPIPLVNYATANMDFAKQQLEELIRDPPNHFIEPKRGTNLLECTITLCGPPNTPYREGLFPLKIVCCCYPVVPPKIFFLTSIHHCNVSNTTGECFLDSRSFNWIPFTDLSRVLMQVYNLLSSCDPRYPAEAWIAEQYITQPEEYERAARFSTLRHAIAHPVIKSDRPSQIKKDDLPNIERNPVRQGFCVKTATYHSCYKVTNYVCYLNRS